MWIKIIMTKQLQGLLIWLAYTQAASSYDSCRTSYTGYELCRNGCCWNARRLYYDCCTTVIGYSIDQEYDATIIGLLVFTGLGSFTVLIGCVFCFCLRAHLAIWCIDGCDRRRGGWVLCPAFYEWCQTSYTGSEYCLYYCCTGFYHDYCCDSRNSNNYLTTTSSYTYDFPYWIIAPIVIGSIVLIASVVSFIVCCCVAANGKTRYQSWSSRRVGATSIEMTSSVNQQQSTMNNLPYPQQQYPGYPMYQQPYPMYQQPYGLGPQFGGPQPPMQPGSSQPSVPPPYSYEQGNQDASYPPKY